MNFKVIVFILTTVLFIDSDINAQTGLKDMVKSGNGSENFFIGTAFDAYQLGAADEEILSREFNVMVPENSAKLTVAHPRPGVWRWERMDSLVAMARRKDLFVRLHGPIGPQCSKWVKDDARTPDELSLMLEEFMTAQCRRFANVDVIQWMDVVNETVTPGGEWFGPKEGADLWENPWTKIGFESDKNRTPSYILRAFEIATRNTSNIKLVYNQHGGMEPLMWTKVKETILFLRSKGMRVDGVGWQAHLSPDKPGAFNAEGMEYLSSLIDWAHENQLEFHITEIDYRIKGTADDQSLKAQAEAYRSILAMLLSKSENGVVTFSTWGVRDREGENRFIFDTDLKPKPAYFALKKTLSDHQKNTR